MALENIHGVDGRVPEVPQTESRVAGGGHHQPLGRVCAAVRQLLIVPCDRDEGQTVTGRQAPAMLPVRGVEGTVCGVEVGPVSIPLVHLEEQDKCGWDTPDPDGWKVGQISNRPSV